MIFLKTPENKFSSFQERAQFIFVWRITVGYTFIGLLMSVFTFIKDNRFLNYYLAAFIISLTGLFLLSSIKAYKEVAIVLYFTIAAILSVAIFTLPDSLHLQEALWMVVVILTSFFTLGNRWGVFYLIVNTILYFFYYNYVFKPNAHFIAEISLNELFVLSIEFGIAMFLIGFVMVQYGLLINQAVKQTSDAYNELKVEKQIVEHQNKEKTVLLQEIHHRVKNNLQVIVSILRLQSRELKAEKARDSFEEAITRILTMSLIHQKLYEKESLMNIDIKDYLKTLIENLIDTGTVDKTIVFNLVSNLKSVSAKSIVPLGFIINELVSNTIKHAFEKSGRIELILTPGEGGTFLMTYFDNGVWKENSGSTFGTQLIEVFTEQLDGSYRRETNDTGTYYYFELTNEQEE
jgi:two-component sensor histidine kinase